jgi:hypothetical protein
MSEYGMGDGEARLGLSDWRPIRVPTCRIGGCPALADEGTECCAKHRDEVTARRAAAQYDEETVRQAWSAVLAE